MPPYPLVEFVLSAGTWTTSGEAYPDTGFEGGIVIPAGAGREVLAEPDTSTLELADGTRFEARTWHGTIELEGRSFDVEVVALGRRYLLGRELMDQFEICFEFGRRVNLRFRDATR